MVGGFVRTGRCDRLHREQVGGFCTRTTGRQRVISRLGRRRINALDSAQPRQSRTWLCAKLSWCLSRRIRGPSSLLKRQRAIRVFIWIQTLGAAPEQHSQEGKKQPGVLAQRVPAAPCLASSALRRCDASTQCRVPFLLVTQGVQMFRAAPRCSPKRARQGAWCRPCHFRANPRNAVWRALGSQPYGTVALF